MSGDWVQDVVDFHNQFGCYSSAEPRSIPSDIEELRWKLIIEELNELAGGMFEEPDLGVVADSIADLIYVLIGTAIAYGIDLRPIWDAVQKANMAKVGGGVRGDGKILKPPGWTPPDIDKLLNEQQPLGIGNEREEDGNAH